MHTRSFAPVAMNCTRSRACGTAPHVVHLSKNVSASMVPASNNIVNSIPQELLDRLLYETLVLLPVCSTQCTLIVKAMCKGAARGEDCCFESPPRMYILQLWRGFSPSVDLHLLGCHGRGFVTFRIRRLVSLLVVCTQSSCLHQHILDCQSIAMFTISCLQLTLLSPIFPQPFVFSFLLKNL